MTLQHSALHLAHQQPHLRASLVPLLREQRRRVVVASATHVVAQNAVELLKNSPELKRDLLQALVKAGVPKKKAAAALSFITGQKEKELVAAVEQGLSKKPSILKRLGKALLAVLKVFGKAFYWLGKKIIEHTAGAALWLAARLALLAGFAYLLYSFVTDPIGSAHTAEALFGTAKTFLSKMF